VPEMHMDELRYSWLRIAAVRQMFLREDFD
jgi:hypothetical protein